MHATFHRSVLTLTIALTTFSGRPRRNWARLTAGTA